MHFAHPTSKKVDIWWGQEEFKTMEHTYR